MARLTDNEKSLILADYHTNKYSQRQLSKKYNVSLGTINNLTKDIEPKNEHLVNAQVSILSAKSYLTNEQLNAIMNTAQEEIFNKGLITNASQLSLIRSTEQLSKNKKQTIVKTKIYSDGRVVGEEPEIIDIELDTSDIKNIQETVDKASITLGVNQRHANSQVNIQNTNAVQNNLKTLDDFYDN